MSIQLKNNYISFLKTLNFNIQEVNLLNNNFNMEINSKKLSMREIKQRFDSLNLVSEKNKYVKLKLIFSNVYFPSPEIIEYILDKINIYVNYLKEQELLFENFKEIIYQSDLLQINFPSNDKVEKYLKDILKYFLIVKKEISIEWFSQYPYWNFIVKI